MNEYVVDVVIVEDSPEDRELTMRALTRHRLANRIQVIEDGAEALDFFFGRGQHAGRDTSHTPKVVLLDLKLPKVSGLEVLRQLRGDPRTAKVPVVVLTSSREERDLTEAYALGANSYIVKPVEFDRFADAVRDVGLYWVLLNERPEARSSP